MTKEDCKTLRPIRRAVSSDRLPESLAARVLDRLPIPTVIEYGVDTVYLNAAARALWPDDDADCSNLPVMVDEKPHSLLDLRWPSGGEGGTDEFPIVHAADGARYAMDGAGFDGESNSRRWRAAFLNPLDGSAGESRLFPEKLNRLKAIVHEIRNMLTAVKETLALLCEEAVGPIEPDQRRFLRSAMDDVEGLVRSTVDLMSLWTTRAGVLQMAPRPVDLHGALEQATLGLAPAAQRQTVSLTTTIAEDVPLLTGDKGLLVQALRNVLTNALRFTPMGGTIQVDVHTDTTDGVRSIVIEVRDSGAGICATDRERIFRPFERGKTGDPSAGMGLGLSISRDIAIAHGGDLTTGDTTGGGACFVFRFPLAESTERAWFIRATQRTIDEVRPLSAPLACVLLSFGADGLDSPARLHPELLSAVHQLAFQSLRPTDSVLAVNERLLLLIRGSSRAGAFAMIDRVLESMAAMFNREDARFGECNMTFGVAVYPQDGPDAASILAKCELELSAFPVGGLVEAGERDER